MDFNIPSNIFAVQTHVLISTGDLFLYISEPQAEPEQAILNPGAQTKEKRITRNPGR